MLSHQQPPSPHDSGPEEVLPAVVGSQQGAKQDMTQHMEESSASFESSVFVRLGRSLELSSHQIDQEIHYDDGSNHGGTSTNATGNNDDATITNQHVVESVSIIPGDEAKEKDDDADDSHLWSDDHFNQNEPRRTESIWHRFKTVVGVAGSATLSPVFSFRMGNSFGWTGCLLMAIFAMGVSMTMHVIAHHATTAGPTMPSPKQDLQSFVALERDRNDMDKLEDLRTEGFQRYARSACVAAGTLEHAQEALFIQLSGIPEDVRKHTIERALIEGITHRSSLQDSSSQLGSHGRAHSYMAFWSTVYNPRGRDFKYETCVLVAGMEIGVMEVIAGYKTEEKNVVVGSIPCECGYFYCAGTCPLLQKVIEKTPIFQRRSLSLKQQDDLHRWLVKNAIDAAESIVSGANIPNLPNTNGAADKNSKKTSWGQVEVLGWKKPPLESFYLDQVYF